MMLEIALEAEEEWDSSSSWEPRVRKAAQAAIAESAFPELGKTGREVELSVRLASDDEVRALNAEWRRKDKPTNVLSFPMAEAYELQEADEDGPTIMLGDLILAHGVCEREAAEKGISVEEAAKARAATIPARRFGAPAEFGAAAAFLCSAQAGYITGQNLLIDGGTFNGAF